jgi:hypothetical protein
MSCYNAGTQDQRIGGAIVRFLGPAIIALLALARPQFGLQIWLPKTLLKSIGWPYS